MLTGALFTIAKTWKQMCSIEEWVKKIRCIYTMEYYSTIKKKERMPFAAILVELVIIIVSEVRQTGKDKCHTMLLICGIKKMVQMTLLTNQK